MVVPNFPAKSRIPIMQCFGCMFRICLVLKMHCSCHVWTKIKSVYRRIGNGNAFCWEVKVCWYFVVKYVKWAIPFNNIPCRGYMFLTVIPLRNFKLKTLYPEEFQAVTNSKLKTFYPWRIPSTKHISPKEFHAQNTLCPWGIPKSKSFTPEEFQLMTNFKPKTLYPWKILKTHYP